MERKKTIKPLFLKSERSKQANQEQWCRAETKHRGRCSRDLSRDIKFKNIKWNKQTETKRTRMWAWVVFWFCHSCPDGLFLSVRLLTVNFWFDIRPLCCLLHLNPFASVALPRQDYLKLRDLKWEHWLRLSSVDQRMKGWWSQSGFGLNDSCWVSKFPRAVFVIIVFVMNVTSSLKRCVN